ncbi:MAG TPA: choline/ethanolamine kinase family protein [Paracoccaceae bacterium]|nr:choline/ethanolamine kinase family protein [Paracoccaceae bacterium]
MEEADGAVLGGLPFVDPDAVPQRLGGLTNRVYRMGRAVVRLPGAGTEAYIDRAAEAAAARAAAAAGVAPAVIHADPATGIMATAWIDGTVTMTPEGFATRPGAAARAGAALARLHRSGAVFPAWFELFAMVDRYLDVLAPRDVTLPDGYHDVLEAAQAVRAALDRAPVAPVACHCDPLCENFLDAGDRMWIVDWEYAGMNDPMWDLGDLSVEAGMDAATEAAMLTAWFGGEPPPAALGRVTAYKAMCDLLWTLWGLIQLSDGNPADDFRAYADGRFARCRALMGQPDFARAIAAIG